MNGRPTLTDDAIATMLRARSAAPIPSGLEHRITRAVLEDVRDTERAGRGRSPGHRSWPLLLVAAALLLTVAGGALVLARPTDQRPPSTPGPSAAILAPTPSLEAVREPCTGPVNSIKGPLFGPGADIDEQTGIVGRADTPVRNGPILAMAGRDPADGPVPWIDLWRVDSVRDDPSAETRFMGTFGFGRRAVQAMVPTPNGAAVAVAVDPYDGPVLTHPDCADIALITTADGRSAGGIFQPASGERYTDPVWSADGGRLYAVRANSRPCTEVAVSATHGSYECTTPLQSSIVAWDVATDTILDLGRPCGTCMPEGRPILSPDGRRVAVPYTDGSRGYQVATLDADGRWHQVPPVGGPSSTLEALRRTTGTTWAELGGWIDEDHALMVGEDGGIFALDVTTGAAERSTCCEGLRSPDGRQVAWIVRSQALGSPDLLQSVQVTKLATDQRVSIRVPESDPVRRLTQVMWSPDSGWLALLVADQETNGHPQLYLAPADGSAAARLVSENADGPIEAWTWAPARP